MQPHLSQAVRLNDMLFTSGQLALRADGSFSSSCATQTRECLEQLDSILREEGLGRTDIVKTTVWIRQASDFAEFNEAYASFFGDHRPARSTVVAELAMRDALVEIEAIGRLGSYT